MEQITHRFTLDLNKSGIQYTLSAVQGDTDTISAMISLRTGNRQYVSLNPESCVVTLFATKPDGTRIVNNCTLSGNFIVCNFTAQTVAAAGNVLCELEIAYMNTDGTVQSKTTPKFIIDVEECVQNFTEIQSTDEFTALSEALLEAREKITDVTEAADAAEDAQTAAETAQALAVTAKNEAVIAKELAEGYANAASGSATAALGSAGTATTKSGEASESAQNASNYADSAATSALSAETSATNANSYKVEASASQAAAAQSAIDAAENATNAANAVVGSKANLEIVEDISNDFTPGMATPLKLGKFIHEVTAITPTSFNFCYVTLSPGLEKVDGSERATVFSYVGDELTVGSHLLIDVVNDPDTEGVLFESVTIVKDLSDKQDKLTDAQIETIGSATFNNTASGKEIHLKDSASSSFRSLTMRGETAEGGVGITDPKISICGKNLLTNQEHYGINNDVVADREIGDYSYTARGNADTSTYGAASGQLMFPLCNDPKITEHGISVGKATTYALSFDATLLEAGALGASIRVIVYNLNGTVLGVLTQTDIPISSTSTRKTVTISTGTYSGKIGVCFRINGNYLNIKNIQLESSAAATEYTEPLALQIVTVLGEFKQNDSIVVADGVAKTKINTDGELVETDITETEIGQALLLLHGNLPYTEIVSDADTTVEYVCDTKAYIDNKFSQLQNAVIALGGTI